MKIIIWTPIIVNKFVSIVEWIYLNPLYFRNIENFVVEILRNLMFSINRISNCKEDHKCPDNLSVNAEQKLLSIL